MNDTRGGERGGVLLSNTQTKLSFSEGNVCEVG